MSYSILPSWGWEHHWKTPIPSINANLDNENCGHGSKKVSGVVAQKCDRHFCGVARHVCGHVGEGWHKLTSVTKRIPERELFNVYQAIHFPLPDDDCRGRLLTRFLEGVTSTDLNLDELVARSNGSSAAFIEEWIRRAILIAISEREHSTESVHVTMNEINMAMHEIVESGGTLTKKLLGHG